MATKVQYGCLQTVTHSLRSGLPGCIEAACHRLLVEMRLHATVKSMASYLLAGTLQAGQAAQLLLITLWLSLTMLPMHCKPLIQA